MTLVRRLPAPAPIPAPLSNAERLASIEARLDLLADGIRDVLAEVVALRERLDS